MYTHSEECTQNSGGDDIRLRWYGAATMFYNQELSAISQRNMAFLIVQSILVTAFVTMVINADKFPWALTIFMWAISVGGSLFCLFHHIAGRSGAQAAANWRRYMCHIENCQTDAAWKRFYEYSNTDHEKHGEIPPKRRVYSWLRNLFARFLCPRCLFERLPLPVSWIITPAIFAAAWVLTSAYLTRRMFLEGDPLRANPFLPLALAQTVSVAILVISVCILVYILWQYRTWWITTIPETWVPQTHPVRE